MVGALSDWVAGHGVLLGALALLGVVSLLATVFALPWLLVRIPEDYFRHGDRRELRADWRHPLVRRVLALARNLLGGLLVIAGVAMLVLPGQGLLTILIGLVLTDFPGKYALEKRLVRRPGVLRAINWLRRRAGHPPLLPPADDR